MVDVDAELHPKSRNSMKRKTLRKNILTGLLGLLPPGFAAAQIYNVGNDDGFSFACAGSAGNELFLPISISRFEAVCSPTEILIKWIISADDKPNLIIPKKSMDGKNFYQFKTEIRNKNGVYSCSDKTPRRTVQYYRLKQLNTRQMDEYSRVIASMCEIHKPLILPNPSSGKFTIHADEPFGRIIIKDLTGRPVHESAITDSNPVIDAFLLENGIYSIEIHTEFSVLEQRIIISK